MLNACWRPFVNTKCSEENNGLWNIFKSIKANSEQAHDLLRFREIGQCVHTKIGHEVSVAAGFPLRAQAQLLQRLMPLTLHLLHWGGIIITFFSIFPVYTSGLSTTSLLRTDMIRMYSVNVIQ